MPFLPPNQQRQSTEGTNSSNNNNNPTHRHTVPRDWSLLNLHVGLYGRLMSSERTFAGPTQNTQTEQTFIQFQP